MIGPGSIRGLLCGLILIPSIAGAALSDEIQVYTDDINAPGEFGLELHINTTPKGRRVPDYPGEVVPNHGLRITPEFSYGLTETWEAGLYIPTNRDPSGNVSAAGAKLRLKWLPIRPAANEAGWFAGANGELSRLQQKFSQSRDAFELRIMNGYRDEAWLLALNPVFGWELSKGYRNSAPDFSLSDSRSSWTWSPSTTPTSGRHRTSFRRQSKATRFSSSPISNSRAGA